MNSFLVYLFILIVECILTSFIIVGWEPMMLNVELLERYSGILHLVEVTE